MSDTHLQASFLMSPNLKSFIPKQGIQVLLHRQNKTFPVPGYFTSLFDVNSFNIEFVNMIAMYIHYSHVIKSLCTIYNDSGDTLWIYVLIYFEYYLDNNGASYDCSK